MNHADREALSELLACIETNDADTIGPTSTLALAKARDIVDRAGPDFIITIPGTHIHDTNRIRDAVKAAFSQPPNPGLDAFLTEPIHEYVDRIPARRRHRALSPLKLAVALVIAATILIALTASSTPGLIPEPHPGTSGAPKVPSRPAQTGYEPLGPTRTAPNAETPKTAPKPTTPPIG